MIFAISRGILCCTRVCYMVSHESHLLHHAKPCSSSNPMSLQLLTSSNDCLLCLISACACLNCCSVLDFYQAKGQITASRPSTYSVTHSEALHAIVLSFVLYFKQAGSFSCITFPRYNTTQCILHYTHRLHHLQFKVTPNQSPD